MSPPPLTDKHLWETVWGSGTKQNLGGRPMAATLVCCVALGRGLPHLSAIKWGSSQPHAHPSEGPRR